MNKLILAFTLIGSTVLGTVLTYPANAHPIDNPNSIILVGNHNNNNNNNNYNDCQDYKDGKYNHQWGNLWCRSPVQDYYNDGDDWCQWHNCSRNYNNNRHYHGNGNQQQWQSGGGQQQQQ